MAQGMAISKGEYWQMKKKQCEIEGCPNPARYAIYKTFPDGRKRWLHVCDYHDKQIGRENILRAGGRYTREMKQMRSEQ